MMTPFDVRPLTRVATTIAIFFTATIFAVAASAPAGSSVRVRPPDEVEFFAVVHAAAFDGSRSMPGYHAIVWKEGRAAGDALLEAEPSDVEVLDRLETLGARGSDNVPMAAWDERKDAKNPAADTVIAGPEVEILLRLLGRKELVPLSDVLVDGGKKGIEFRMGGHRGNIDRWHSGCVACLYSCPGAKVGNARYTVREYGDPANRFRVKPGILPPDGTRIGVVLRLRGKRSG